MVSPLGQRQMFQTMNLEAVRAASEVGGLLQREAGQAQAVAEHMAEAQTSVPEIPKTDAMRTEERQGRSKEGENGSSMDHGEDQEPESGEATASKANPADTHLDFLA